ncbi:Uncharacterized protein HZ326_3572 [Fusarium oxysporum f. sp. albedinis]|nr:Uncharacterized protein HZ326_3572 [Fusarium oxysporum f. sp. albedinis]
MWPGGSSLYVLASAGSIIQIPINGTSSMMRSNRSSNVHHFSLGPLSDQSSQSCRIFAVYTLQSYLTKISKHTQCA